MSSFIRHDKLKANRNGLFMKNYAIFLSFLLILLASCSTKNYVGLYGKCGHGYLSCNQLLLEKSGEFTYYEYWDVGGVDNLVKGKWRILNDTLILNSHIQPQDRLDSVFESRVENQDSITFVFLNSTSKSIEFANLRVNNDSFEYISNDHGVCNLEKGKSVDSLTIMPWLSIESLEYKVQNKNSNYFELYISEPKIHFYFTNEKWLIKNQKVYLHQDTTGHFDKNIYKKKTADKNRVFENSQ